MLITDELRNLFDIVRTKLGYPIRPIQLEDEQLCNLLEVAIGDYSEKVMNWLIQSNWLSFYGNNTNFLTNQDIMFGLTTRMLDYTKDFSYWFSKDVGLQQRGKYELKKDFFKIECGKQSYLVPPGREINKVLYITPSTTRAAALGTQGMIGYNGMGVPFGQLAGSYTSGFYVGQAVDVAMLAADLSFKNSLFSGELCYKVTALSDGSHIIHLMSTPRLPGMKYRFDDSKSLFGALDGCYCWYTYYDVDGMSDDEIDACRIANKDDIVLTPDQVPMQKLRYELMNVPTQNIIRQLLVAEAMITIGLIRGTYSGVVSIPDAQLQMDYSIYIDQGTREKERVFNDLKERLESMLPWNMLKNMSDMTDNLQNILNKKPLGFIVR